MLISIIKLDTFLKVICERYSGRKKNKFYYFRIVGECFASDISGNKPKSVIIETLGVHCERYLGIQSNLAISEIVGGF